MFTVGSLKDVYWSHVLAASDGVELSWKRRKPSLCVCWSVGIRFPLFHCILHMMVYSFWEWGSSWRLNTCLYFVCLFVWFLSIGNPLFWQCLVFVLLLWFEGCWRVFLQRLRDWFVLVCVIWIDLDGDEWQHLGKYSMCLLDSLLVRSVDVLLLRLCRLYKLCMRCRTNS